MTDNNKTFKVIYELFPYLATLVYFIIYAIVIESESIRIIIALSLGYGGIIHFFAAGIECMLDALREIKIKGWKTLLYEEEVPYIKDEPTYKLKDRYNFKLYMATMIACVIILLC